MLTPYAPGASDTPKGAAGVGKDPKCRRPSTADEPSYALAPMRTPPATLAAPGAAGPDDRLDWPGAGLSPRSRRVAWAVAEALLCDEDDRGDLVPASPETCDRAVAALDLSIGRSSADVRRGFAALSLVMELLPIFVIGAFARMSRLPLDRRLAYLEALEGSRIGLLSMLLIAFKVPLCIPAFEEGEDLLSTGFDRATTASRRRLPVAPAREAA